MAVVAVAETADATAGNSLATCVSNERGNRIGCPFFGWMHFLFRLADHLLIKCASLAPLYTSGLQPYLYRLLPFQLNQKLPAVTLGAMESGGIVVDEQRAENARAFNLNASIQVENQRLH